MALPDFFKLHILNKTGATIEFATDGANNSFVITGKPWKRDSNGALSFGSEVTLFADPAADLAANADAEGAEFDNSTNKYEGMFCHAKLDTDAVVSGRVEVYLEWPTDGASGSYPSDAPDFDENTIESDLILVGQVACSSTDDDRRANFEI